MKVEMSKLNYDKIDTDHLVKLMITCVKGNDVPGKYIIKYTLYLISKGITGVNSLNELLKYTGLNRRDIYYFIYSNKQVQKAMRKYNLEREAKNNQVLPEISFTFSILI